MSRGYFAIWMLCLLMSSCSKTVYQREKGQTADASNTLLGKWKFTEQYYSIGGPGQWHPVQPSGQTIEFRPDGSLQSAASFSSHFRKYEIIDSNKVKFTPAPTASGYILMEYAVDPTEQTMLLTPVDPICIEGCHYKFKR